VFAILLVSCSELNEVQIKKLELKEKMYKMCIDAGGIPRIYNEFEIVCDPKSGYSSTMSTTK
jgi:hypothetical protein